MSAIAKKAALEAAQVAEKKALKQATEAAAAAAAKNAAKTVLKTDAKALAKTEAKQAAEIAAKKEAKAVSSDAAKTAAKSTGKETKDTALQKAAQFASKNPKLVIGGMTAAAIAGVATNKFLERNGKNLNVTKIESVPSSVGGISSLVKITFSPEFDFQSTDKVTVTKSNCQPNVDGEQQEITSILSKTEIILTRAISNPGNSGNLVTHTSFEAQLTDTATDAASKVVDVAADVATDVGGGILNKVFPDASNMINNIMSYKYYAISIVCILIVLKLYISWPRSR